MDAGTMRPLRTMGVLRHKVTRVRFVRLCLCGRWNIEIPPNDGYASSQSYTGGFGVVLTVIIRVGVGQQLHQVKLTVR